MNPATKESPAPTVLTTFLSYPGAFLTIGATPFPSSNAPSFPKELAEERVVKRR